MASSSTFLNRTCMILPNESNPTEFAKDQRPYKYDEINVAIENPVDLESIRVNGFAEVVNLFKKQGFELLETVPKDKLSEREKFYIDFYKTKETGLNERSG